MDTNLADISIDSTPEVNIKKRRQYSLSLKREMVEATLDGKDSVSVVARRYDVNANQLFRWRRQYLAGQLQVKPVMPDLIPVQVNDTDHDASQSTRGSDTLSGQLQIILSNRHRVTITGRVCQQSLATILQALS